MSGEPVSSAHTDVGGYALGLLEAADRQAFEEHLAGCPACAAELAELSGMKDLLSAGKKPAEHLELAALDVPGRSAAVTVTGRSRPDRKARKGQLLDTSDLTAAAAELVSALRGAGAL